MKMIQSITGVYSAAATPIEPDGSPCFDLFTTHCSELLAEGCHGIALLGTTGEANNFSVDERMALLDAVCNSGISGEQLLPGTSCSNLSETKALTAHALSCQVKACVILPPFYYKGVSDEGLFRFYAQLVEGLADSRLKIILYHIPQMTQVPISHELIYRLRTEFPDIFVGIKDSAGDIGNMKKTVERFPGFSVLAGADPLLLPLLQAGGAGCITATSNLRADSLRYIFDHINNPSLKAEIDQHQKRINDWRNLSNSYAQLATIKAMISKVRGDARWCALRPPLTALTAQEQEKIWAQMQQI
jgi:4-hydroxy-tetrahydrodipicolinate synthase